MNEQQGEFYRREIIEMVSKIQEFKYLESIYWFIKGMFCKKENGTE